jgi:hypothetical protein
VELRDLIVTPLLIIIVYVVAYRVRPLCTDSNTRKYFFPALSFKILGALALGFIYQFYYEGGDTFNYHTHGSRHIWEAFMDSPEAGMKLLFLGKDQTGIYQYSSKIPFFYDPQSYFIIRIAAFFDLLTFSSYSGTSVLFSVVSFTGAWLFFITFYRRYPTLNFQIAICSLFIPSVIFWGSGILKDTIVVAALGIATYCIDVNFIQLKWRWSRLLLLLIVIFLILRVKIFILQAFIPAALTWVFYNRLVTTPSVAVRVLVLPLIFISILGISYLSVVKIGEGDSKYSLDKIATTAKITAYDIGFYTGRDAGSRYSLGSLDGTFSGMVAKVPQAINVSLFRPYVWEVKNPLMFLTSLEGTILLGICMYVLIKIRFKFFKALSNPDIIFALVFSLTMAFAVGITSYNFGTLARYKIPLMPYFTLALVLIYFEKEKENFLD